MTTPCKDLCNILSCNKAADAIETLRLLAFEELGLLLEFDLESECGEGGSTASRLLISVVLLSCICRLFFSFMIALSKEFSVDLLDLDEL